MKYLNYCQPRDIAERIIRRGVIGIMAFRRQLLMEVKANGEYYPFRTLINSTTTLYIRTTNEYYN